MKWIDFKRKIESLGFGDDTEIRFFVMTYDGDSYELDVKNIEDEDRKCNYEDCVDVELSDPPKEYRDYFNDSYVDELLDELGSVIDKYR